MNNRVKFLRGTSDEYAAAVKDNDAIYFTTDDGKLYIGDKEISGDGSLTIDDTLSDTSENPVQNKVIKEALDNKADASEIPDLSEYAKKTDIPNIKVNEAVNANTVGGKLPEKIFYDNGFSPDLNGATKSGCYAAIPETINTPLPSLWWIVNTMNFNNSQYIVQKAYMMGDATNTVPYIRNYANGVWSDWTEIYTTGNKPYISGSAAVEANSQICVTNHGFMPSAAIWWDSTGTSGVAVYFNETQFVTEEICTSARTVNYLIFK